MMQPPGHRGTGAQAAPEQLAAGDLNSKGTAQHRQGGHAYACMMLRPAGRGIYGRNAGGAGIPPSGNSWRCHLNSTGTAEESRPAGRKATTGQAQPGPMLADTFPPFAAFIALRKAQRTPAACVENAENAGRNQNYIFFRLAAV